MPHHVLTLAAAISWLLAGFYRTPLAAVEGSAGGDALVRWVVIGVTIAAFIAAVLAGRHAFRSAPVTFDGGIGDPRLLEADLLLPTQSMRREPRIVQFFAGAFLVVLLGYAFFDRGFAWFHIPGTPLFVGELLIILGIGAMLAHTVPMMSAIRRSPPLKVLVVYMGWGLALLLLQVSDYGIDTIRDSALWYYGIAAFFTAFLMLSDPSRLPRWLAGFARILPWLLGWLFVSVVLGAILGERPPFVPDSQISIFSHSTANAAILAVAGIGVLWLVDQDSKYYSARARLWMTGATAVLVLFVSVQNRGGLVAAGLGILAIAFFMRKRRTELFAVIVGVFVVIAVVALVSNVRVALFSEREVSAEQFINNAVSIVSPDKGGERQTGTVEWRLEVWSAVINDVTNQFPVTGYGPGPHLGEIYNIEGLGPVALRNPHNSHVGVVARLGWVGAGIWAVMWGVWALLLLDLVYRLRKQERWNEAGLGSLVMIVAGMILSNAIFDPTIEGPQVGIWLWFIYGLGATLLLRYSGFNASSRSVAAGSGSALGTVVGSSRSGVGESGELPTG